MGSRALFLNRFYVFNLFNSALFLAFISQIGCIYSSRCISYISSSLFSRFFMLSNSLTRVVFLESYIFIRTLFKSINLKMVGLESSECNRAIPYYRKGNSSSSKCVIKEVFFNTYCLIYCKKLCRYEQYFKRFGAFCNFYDFYNFYANQFSICIFSSIWVRVTASNFL